jgi:hypothetical protein
MNKKTKLTMTSNHHHQKWNDHGKTLVALCCAHNLIDLWGCHDNHLNVSDVAYGLASDPDHGCCPSCFGDD